jgi:hypothetical protein
LEDVRISETREKDLTATAGVGPDCVQESIDKAKQSVDNELTL